MAYRLLPQPPINLAAVTGPGTNVNTKCGHGQTEYLCECQYFPPPSRVLLIIPLDPIATWYRSHRTLIANRMACLPAFGHCPPGAPVPPTAGHCDHFSGRAG